jgi:uncharacterized protein YbaR (Trm112 family)
MFDSRFAIDNGFMIDAKYLEILRCPIDPKREAKLVLNDIKVVCECCRVQFKSREGFLSLIVEEALLPEGCASVGELPCRESGVVPVGSQGNAGGHGRQ